MKLQFALVTLLHLPLTFGQYVQTVEPTVVGVATITSVWKPEGPASPTFYFAKYTVPAAQPTLVWNCASMPAICRNVGNWIAANRPNAFAGGASLSLHYDATKEKKWLNGRRGHSCESAAWRQTTCPMNNQPAIVHRENTPLHNTALQQANPGFTVPVRTNEIAGYTYLDNGQTLFNRSALLYTCDEFPPASTIEGGDGNANVGVRTSANIICAPQSWTCSLGKLKVPNSVTDESEQDWQARSINKLIAALRRAYGTRVVKGSKTSYKMPTGVVMRYQFTTTMGAQATDQRAWVVLGGNTDFVKDGTPRAMKKRSVVETGAPKIHREDQEALVSAREGADFGAIEEIVPRQVPVATETSNAAVMTPAPELGPILAKDDSLKGTSSGMSESLVETSLPTLTRSEEARSTSIEQSLSSPELGNPPLPDIETTSSVAVLIEDMMKAHHASEQEIEEVVEAVRDAEARNAYVDASEIIRMLKGLV